MKVIIFLKVIGKAHCRLQVLDVGREFDQSCHLGTGCCLLSH